MRLILGISKDGYLARCKNDDMQWLGATDKAIFRILTGVSGLLFTSLKTAESMPTQLAGRRLEAVSTRNDYPSLDEVAQRFPDAWLIGGPSLARVALKEDLIDEAHLCISDRFAFPDPATPYAIPDYITPLLTEDPRWKMTMKTTINEVTVQKWAFHRVT